MVHPGVISRLAWLTAIPAPLWGHTLDQSALVVAASMKPRRVKQLTLTSIPFPAASHHRSAHRTYRIVETSNQELQRRMALQQPPHPAERHCTPGCASWEHEPVARRLPGQSDPEARPRDSVAQFAGTLTKVHQSCRVCPVRSGPTILTDEIPIQLSAGAPPQPERPNPNRESALSRTPSQKPGHQAGLRCVCLSAYVRIILRTHAFARGLVNARDVVYRARCPLIEWTLQTK